MKFYKLLSISMLNCLCVCSVDAKQKHSVLFSQEHSNNKCNLSYKIPKHESIAQIQLNIFLNMPSSVRSVLMSEVVLFTENLILATPQTRVELHEMIIRVSNESLKIKMPKIYEEYFQERHKIDTSILVRLKKTSSDSEEKKVFTEALELSKNLKDLPKYKDILPEIEASAYLFFLADCYAQKEKIENNKIFILNYTSYYSLLYYIAFIHDKDFSQSFTSRNPELLNFSLKELEALNDSLHKQILEKIHERNAASQGCAEKNDRKE